VTKSESIYDSPRLAAGYAYDRPAVHGRIIEAAREHLHITSRLGRALDVGCGAGLSTAALEPLAKTVIGLEPVHAMLAHSRVVAPHALFVVGRAERLPFSAGAFDLIAYDFSAGRHVREGPQLDEWFTIFARRYPSSPGYELDVKALPITGPDCGSRRARSLRLPCPSRSERTCPTS
jgi:SAM-dependent methyltransferase